MKHAWLLLLGLGGLLGWSAPACAEPAPREAASGEIAAPQAVPTAAQLEFFERHVRPVLTERCLGCHGAKKQEGSLRLDSRPALMQGGDGGPVVDLKNPAASRILKAIGYQDPDLQMPPESEGKLPEAAVAALTAWIGQGAPWPADAATHAPASDAWKSHWAFQPVREPPIPAVRQTAWPRSPIDRFVLASLEGQGMTPGEPADRPTLIRRATFDLIGLPPTEQEVASFVADSEADAFAKVVERLLESPHYGERWGRYWLDVARYADTKGYVRLQEERRFHHAYTYRDYVIRALNEDLPFDRFIVEQIAADQLPLGDDPGALAALGFLTLGRRFTGNPHDIVDDRIDVVSRGLLGLTVTCARCHDHKYDPVPTADYYSLYGVFASSEDPLVPPLVSRVPSDAATEAFQREFESRKQALDEYEPQQYAALVNEFRAQTADYLLKVIEGRAPLQQPLPTAHGEIRPFVVDRWCEYLDRAGPRHPVLGPWNSFATLKAAEFAAHAAELIAGWIASPGEQSAGAINALVLRKFAEQPPKSMADVAREYGELLTQTHQHWQSLAAATTAAAAGAVERLSNPPEEEIRQVLYAEDSPVAVSRQEAVTEYLYDAPIQDEVVKRRGAVTAWLADTAKAPPRAHTLAERSRPHDPRILARGNPTRPGRAVPRQFLSVLSSAEREPFRLGGGRLELAQAIASRENPLTARVLVNRVWGHHFGNGLVRTPSNFGMRGQLPTHPQLLDYLAARFMNEGWSIKKLHRWIMLSSVYQQSSRDREGYLARDPENRLLWKMNRRRLDFEALRDSMLTAAGQLDLSLSGPSIDLAAPDARRRSVYGLIDRQGLPGLLPTFDFASPDTHNPERYTTTVPQQALFLMNSPTTLAIARALAGRDDVKTIPAAPDRASRMMQIAWGRSPTEREIRLAMEFVERDNASRGAEGANRGADGAPDTWEAFAQTLLLANEFMYVD